MRLLYFALQAEAQIFIERLKAKKISSTPKIFISNDTLIVIGGVGRAKLEMVLEEIFTNYEITQAVNIGIAGANSKDISLGELFCIYPQSKIKLISTDTPTTSTEIKEPTLFDMEGEYFLEFTREKALEKIFIFKVVSDYLDSKIPSKSYVKKLIQDRYYQIIKEIDAR